MIRLFRHWKSIYLVCSLVYIGWVILIGVPEFNKVNRQYRLLVNQLEPEQIRAFALEELETECRRESWKRNLPEKPACPSWSSEVVTAKNNTVKERLERARERGLIKVALFYGTFVVIFLLFPPLFIHLFILGIITLCKNIKIVR